MHKTIIGLAAAGLFLSGCASSHKGPPKGTDGPRGGKARSALGPIAALSGGGLLIASFNRNDDYAIDKMEFDQGVSRAFIVADQDKNARLSMIELNHWRASALGSVDARPGTFFFDTTFDQQVSREEFIAAWGKIHQTSDRDNNGQIQFAELVNIVERPSAPQQRGSGRKGGEERRGPPPGGGR